MRIPGALALAALALTLTTSTFAFADGKTTARQHLETGLQLADKGDWEQALVQFEEAHHLDPQPTTLYDVAQARLKTGRYRAAIEAYRALLVAKSSLSSNQLATAQRQLAAAESKVAHLTVVPRGATQASDEITVDDQIVQRSPILLDPGSHVARLRRAGNVVGERRVDLAEGVSLSIDLEPAPPPTEKPIVSAPPPHSDERSKSTAPAWIVLGTSAAVLIVGSIFAIRGYGEWSDLNGSCGPTKTCRNTDVDSAQRDVLIGDIGIGVGLVGAAIGVVMLVTSSSSSATTTKTADSGYPFRW